MHLKSPAVVIGLYLVLQVKFETRNIARLLTVNILRRHSRYFCHQLITLSTIPCRNSARYTFADVGLDACIRDAQRMLLGCRRCVCWIMLLCCLFAANGRNTVQIKRQIGQTDCNLFLIQESFFIDDFYALRTHATSTAKSIL